MVFGYFEEILRKMLKNRECTGLDFLPLSRKYVYNTWIGV